MENQLDALKRFLEDQHISLDHLQLDQASGKYVVAFRIQNLESFFVNIQNPSIPARGMGIIIKMVFPASPSSQPSLAIIGDNLPFHPHFTSSDNNLKEIISNFLGTNRGKQQESYWVDYKQPQVSEDIVTFLKRVVSSMQFHRDSMNMELRGMANPEAKEWYLKAYHKDSSTFPTGDLFRSRKKFVTNATPNETRKKKFEPQQKPGKKFEVNPTNEPEHSSKKFEMRSAADQARTAPVKKKFTITEETPGYEPSHKNLSPLHTQQETEAIISDQTDRNVKIFLNKDTQDQIWHHIGWGKRTDQNIVEQGGILLGHVYQDPRTGVQFAIVKKAIPGKSAKGTSAYLEMGHEVWKEMIEMVDNYLDANPNYNIQIIGWYHTHPNSLDVFMSGTDRNTQGLYFYKDWHYAIVLNPHKQIWKAFYGKNAIECEGFFLTDHEVPPSNPAPPADEPADTDTTDPEPATDNPDTSSQESAINPPDTQEGHADDPDSGPTDQEPHPENTATGTDTKTNVETEVDTPDEEGSEQSETKTQPEQPLLPEQTGVIPESENASKDQAGDSDNSDNDSKKKNSGHPIIYVAIVIAVISVVVIFNFINSRRQSDSEGTQQNFSLSPEKSTMSLQPGDTVQVNKDLLIFSLNNDLQTKAAFQNPFDIVLSAVDANFLSFEKELYVDTAEIIYSNGDSASVFLKNQARLLIDAPDSNVNIADMTFAISATDSSIYQVIPKESQSGQVKVMYRARLKSSDIQDSP